MINVRHYFVAAALSLTACGQGQSSTTTSNTDTQAVSHPLAIKQTGTSSGVDVTVTDVTTPKQIGPAPVGLKAEAGETFVVVSYTIKNTGDKALPLTERPELALIDPKGTTYSPDQIASPMAAGLMDDPSGMAADLNPNVSAKTKAAWKVDEAAFDRGTWMLAFGTDPKLTFALK